MKKIASFLAPVAFAALAVPAGAASLSSVPAVHRDSSSARRLSTGPAAAARSTDVGLAQATGIGLNLDVVGRLPASGTIFKTAIDFANNTNTGTQTDAYFEATIGGQDTLIVTSVTTSGLVNQGAGTLDAFSVFHTDDFIDDLRQSGFITQAEEDGGILGSLLVIYNSPSAGLFDQVGQGSVQARFYSENADGTIGVSANGHALTESEPPSVVGIARDTQGEPNTPQLYTNFFIDNEGFVKSDGTIQAEPVQVVLTGYSNSTGQITGHAGPFSIAAYNTIGVSNVFQAVGGNTATDDTLIVFVDITSGNSAISGLSSLNDAGTKDPSAAQLQPADWTAGLDPH